MKRVLVLGNIRPEGIDILKEFSEIIILKDHAEKKDIIEQIGEVDAVLHRLAPFTKDVIQHQKKLRIVARHGVGLDELDLNYLRKLNIPVSTTHNASSNAVAEYTIALIFNLLRHINRAESMIKKDKMWKRELFIGRELKSLKVGIIGFGRIGSLVADSLAAFGCKVVLYDSDPSKLKEVKYPTLSFNALLSSADIISLHCPLSSETRNLINSDNIGLIKKYAIIINTARGGLIEKSALIDALKKEAIGGAALDVFDEEPPNFNDELFRFRNVIVTPHIAAMTINAQIEMATVSASEIRRVLVENLPPKYNIFKSIK